MVGTVWTVGMVGMVGMAMFGDAMISCHEIVLRTHSLHQIYRAVAAFAAEDDRAKVDGILRLDLKPLFPSFSNKGITTCSHIFICFPFFCHSLSPALAMDPYLSSSHRTGKGMIDHYLRYITRYTIYV